jgi:glutathione S-transferase
MTDLKLVIGEQNRSAWSLRAWLLLKQLGLEFEEVVVPLGRADTVEQILRYSPSGKLPILIADSVKVWDAMAIAETLGEHFTDLWPGSAEARAVARSICAEVHGGFRDQQVFLPMDFTSRFAPPGRLLAPVAADVRRIVDIWSTCRSRYGAGGPFLFGEFTIPDAMFAPICAAFTTHSIALDDLARAYVGHMMELPAMLEWADAARGEPGARPTRAATSAAPAEFLQESPARTAAPARGTPFPPPPMPPVPPLIEPAPGPRPAATSFIPVGRPVASPPPPRPGSQDFIPPALPPVPLPEPPPAAASEPEPAEEPPLELTVLAPDEPEDGEDAGPPALGLPGVVPTRPYVEPAAEMQAEAAARRLVRPPGGTGLFRWRAPRAQPAMPEPEPEPVPAPRPRMTSAPEPGRPLRPEPIPPPVAPLQPRPAAPAPVPPEPAPAAAAEELMPPLPSSGRPLLRPGTIKPIGDGIRRRR